MYEYKIVLSFNDEDTEEKLNRMAKKGWILVSTNMKKNISYSYVEQYNNPDEFGELWFKHNQEKNKPNWYGQKFVNKPDYEMILTFKRRLINKRFTKKIINNSAENK